MAIFKLISSFCQASRDVRAATHPTRRAAAERRLDRAEFAMALIARNRSA